jgi:hypothetical protein
VQAQRSFTVSSDLRFAILGKPRGQALVLRDEGGGIPTLVHLARTVPEAETWLNAHPGSRARIVPADAVIPRMFTYLNDVDHGWLIVSRADLDAVGLSRTDFSTWSYFCGDCFALDEHGDMPKFLERHDERGIAYRLYDRRTKGDAHVQQYWFRNERPAGRQQVHDTGLSKYCAF